jgi:hypothetical protein
VVFVRRALVDVRGNPDHVADAVAFQVAEQVGELELASEREAGIAVGHRFVAAWPVADDEPERQPRTRRGSANRSVVAHSTNMRAVRSVRLQMTARPPLTSPAATPKGSVGRAPGAAMIAGA